MVLAEPAPSVLLVRMVMMLITSWAAVEITGSSRMPHTGQPPPGNWLSSVEG